MDVTDGTGVSVSMLGPAGSGRIPIPGARCTATGAPAGVLTALTVFRLPAGVAQHAARNAPIAIDPMVADGHEALDVSMEGAGRSGRPTVALTRIVGTPDRVVALQVVGHEAVRDRSGTPGTGAEDLPPRRRLSLPRITGGHTMTDGFGADVVGALDEELGGITALLLGVADLGEGTILGVVPAGRAGIQRVSRTSAAEFERRLAEAYRDRVPALIRHATRKVGDHGRAEDVVQRAFERILSRDREDRPEISNIDAYVFTTVCNEINRELRDVIPARRNSAEPAELENVIAPRADLSGQVVDVMAVRAALAELAPREREAVIMRLQWQLSVAEAAEVMHLSDGAVKRYTADGVRRLRARLSA